jgi:hypothetical protein
MIAAVAGALETTLIDLTTAVAEHLAAAQPAGTPAAPAGPAAAVNVAA